MTNYQIWSGIDTIGGNIVEVKTENSRVICDFGLSVKTKDIHPNEEVSEVEHLLLSKQLPNIPYLYDTTLFQNIELESLEETTMDQAVFISHLHIDHMGGLKYLPKDWDIYMSEDSFRLLKVLVEQNKDFQTQANIIPLPYDTVVSIGDIQVQLKKSDHDVVGSSAIFMETPELKIVHTGDFRLTGNHPDHVISWAKEAKEANIDIMLTEGTAFSFDKKDSNESEKLDTETKVLKEFDYYLTHTERKVIVINPYIRNVERLYLLNRQALLNRRKIVWEKPFAKVIKEFYPEEILYVCKDRGTDDEFHEMAREEINESPDDFVLQNSLQHTKDLNHFDSGIYLHSNGEPLGAFDPEYEKLRKYLLSINFEFIPMGTSGHATQDDLLKIVKIAGAKKVIPWHSFQPEKMEDVLNHMNIPAMVPSYNRLYSY